MNFYNPITQEKTVFPSFLFFSFISITPYFIIQLLNYIDWVKFFPKKFHSNERIEAICQKISRKMNVEKPDIVLSKKPEVYSLHSDKRSIIVIYEKCKELDNDELEAIIAHELAHIKSGLAKDYTDLLFQYKSFIKYDVVYAIVFLFIFCLCYYIFMHSVQIEKDFAFLAFLIFVLFAEKYALDFRDLEKRHITSFRFGELKADLIAYLTLHNAESIIKSLRSIRVLEAEYYIKNPSKLFLKDTFFKFKKMMRLLYKGKTKYLDEKVKEHLVMEVMLN